MGQVLGQVQRCCNSNDVPLEQNDISDSPPCKFVDNTHEELASSQYHEVEKEMRVECPTLEFSPAHPVYNMDLHEASRRRNINLYYRICRECPGLLVTTSCFTVWRQHNKTNAYAKLIPAVGDSREAGLTRNNVRIFFFDDNLEMGGSQDSGGICNLRDIHTGDFVDFSVGANGFKCEHAGRHTIIHVSDRYRNVLVKANILDAIEDKGYFSSIIARYTKPNEKIIIFMDVNSTIVCNDAVQGKDLRGTLMSTMFEFIELRPRNACEFVWDGSPTVKLEKPMLLRSLVKELTKASAQAYSQFWREATCRKFIDEITPLADLRWCLHDDGNLTKERFYELYTDYVAAIERDVNEEGITSSWFECFKQVKAKHTVVLNSFGVDTRKVVVATGLDEKKVLQIAVNYELWDARDKQKYEALFKPAETA